MSDSSSRATPEPDTSPTPKREIEAERSSARARLTARVRRELSQRLSPERTRRATLVERMTVGRLPWETLVRLNRYLEFFGKLTSVIYFGFVVTVIFGVDWKSVVESTFNSGEPVRGAIALALVLPTLLFVALHSMFGYGRWKLQRELWRRDIGHVESLETESGETKRPDGLRRR